MSRYTGPVHRKSRRYGFSTLESGKEFAKGKQRQTAPGQHGASKRQKLSDYGIHLYEKQKVKYVYGLTEKQLENSFHKSSKLGGVAGTSFLQFLESRLDNLVFRLGFAETRRQARQLVSHGHFLVNGKKVDIPSFSVKVGSTITLKEASKKNKQILEAIEKRGSAAWLEYDKNKLEGKYTCRPERSELNKDINDGLIVEYYNK